MSIDNIAITVIIICLICSVIIIADLFRHPQHMKIMNIVWPVTALYSGPIGLWCYFSIGRSKEKKPFWESVLTGTLHCGGGCTLGDLLAANMLMLFPLVFFGSKLLTEWTAEYVAAFIIGIIFQYYAIKPMKDLSAGEAIGAALKADALSLTFWQIGMYGWMAISNFLIFHRVLEASEPAFWLMMQIGMILGFFTAFPVNWWLIKKGIKEAM
ncbi:MAG TPA: DUF4396 domain-containing protein [Mucilaginibacter sp.]|nr:DUF4396 domain-containing protein [Mucilaginibacter sp.]